MYAISRKWLSLPHPSRETAYAVNEPCVTCYEEIANEVNEVQMFETPHEWRKEFVYAFLYQRKGNLGWKQIMHRTE